MKVIKSNPSKVLNVFVEGKDTILSITSIAEVKQVKITEIQIMDRQSNGSFIVKDRIVSANKVCKMINNLANSDKEPLEIPFTKEDKMLKNVDDAMDEIESKLDLIEDK